jgi:hypothetical protein
VNYLKSAQTTRITVELEQDKLGSALQDLKQRLGIGYELDVKWLPDENAKLSGEVKGTCICIYEVNEEKALETLKHEFLDYLISKSIEPYEKVANLMIRMVNDEGYARKEKLVEALSQLL